MAIKRKRYRQVVSAVTNELWLLTEDKLDDIVNLLHRRMQGEVLDEQALRMQFGFVEEDTEASNFVDGVQVINVDGVLSPRMNLMTRISGGSSTELLSQEVMAAAQNPDVKSIVMAVDSPGGAVSGVPELAEMVRRAGTQKRVVTAARNTMASGAYWVGTASDEVYASPSTMVGSVGAYHIVQDASKAAEAAGVKYTVVRAGINKAADIPLEPKTETQLASIQQRVDKVYGQFVDALAEQRGVSADTVEESFGQGAVFTADEAYERNMVDGVSLYEDVIAREVERARGRVVSGFRGASNMRMYSDKMRAALYARGLVSGIDVSDEICEAACKAYEVATGNKLPDDEDGKLKAIMAPPAAAAEAIPPNQPAGQPQIAPAVATPVDVLTTQRAAIEERNRITQLHAKATLLGIDDSLVSACIESGTSVADAVVQWTDHLGTRSEPARQLDPTAIVPVGSEVDNFVNAATAALCSRLPNVQVDPQHLAMGRTLRRARFSQICEKELQMRGISTLGDEEDVALQWLQLGGTGTRTMQADAAGGSVNNPSEHPDLLSNLVGKMLGDDLPVAEMRYTRWTRQLEDLPDFKPRTIIGTGIWSELDHTTDDAGLMEKLMDSELEAWIAADDYRGGAKLTVTMIANDDLGGFADIVAGFPFAGENTLNNLCIRFLVANVNMVDGNPQFAEEHRNLVATGSPPSAPALAEHRLLHRQQRNRGREGAFVPLGLAPTIWLGPGALEEQIIQTLGNRAVYPAEDGNINTVRGTIEPVVDSYLDDFSTEEYYTFIPPAREAAIAWANRRGYSGGRRTTWFDNDTRTRVISYERSFGVTAKSRRGVVRNPGK